MKKPMEITLLDNGVVIFNAEDRFIGGLTKAKHLRDNGLHKMLSEAKKRCLC